MSFPRPTTYNPQPITINGIFASDHSWTATLSAEKLLTITAVGDIMLGREITSKHLLSGYNYLYASVSGILSSADITIGNLETPITSDCQPRSTGMVFCAPTAHLPPLAASGIDILSLGNNHAYDQGESGINFSLQGIASVGLTALPPNVAQFVTIKNYNIAFIPFSFIPGLKQITPSEQEIKKLISSASLSSDLVIIIPHWGVEYTYQPSQEQVRLAHLFIDSGADLILGSHPHWIQPVEIYQDKLIVYSHGNFIFDQFWSQKTQEGIIGDYIFYGNQLIDARFTPTRIFPDGHPQIIPEQKAKAILDSMYSASWQK